MDDFAWLYLLCAGGRQSAHTRVRRGPACRRFAGLGALAHIASLRDRIAAAARFGVPVAPRRRRVVGCSRRRRAGAPSTLPGSSAEPPRQRSPAPPSSAPARQRGQGGCRTR